MSDQARVLDAKALGEMAELLSHFRVRIDRFIEDAENEIDRSVRETELVRERTADEVRSAESELEAAEEDLRRAESDDDISDLSDLRERRRECKEQLKAALRQLRRIERAQDEVKSAVDRFRSIGAGDTNDILRKGVAFLNEKKAQLENYLRLQPGGTFGSIAGSKTDPILIPERSPPRYPPNRGTHRIGPPQTPLRSKVSPDGTAFWSARRYLSSAENAHKHAREHMHEFSIKDPEVYRVAAMNFVCEPPLTAETFTRDNGEVMVYDPTTNTFGVRTFDGAPSTMFKPKNRLQYWVIQLRKYGGARDSKS